MRYISKLFKHGDVRKNWHVFHPEIFVEVIEHLLKLLTTSRIYPTVVYSMEVWKSSGLVRNKHNGRVGQLKSVFPSPNKKGFEEKNRNKFISILVNTRQLN